MSGLNISETENNELPLRRRGLRGGFLPIRKYSRFNIIPLFFSVILLLPFSSVSFAQAQIDTLTAEMDGVVVVGYSGNRSLMETPGSISYVRPAVIAGFDHSSLVYSLNSVPGVQMEERSTGSYRISIRGSSLRSPFGIRNVKVYWNHFPLTEPSGSTFLNLLALPNMQSLEVIKGPAGSMYGSGTGGVILMESTVPAQNSRFSSGLTAGSYGRIGFDAQYFKASRTSELSLKYANDNSDGYREQSFLKRHTLELSGKTEMDIGGTFFGSILVSKLNYGIPGGLNIDQFNSDPTQARPGNPFALGSVEADAGIDQESLIFGTGYRNEFNSGLNFEFVVFGSFSEFENPFNLDYKKDDRGSGGFRTSLSRSGNLSGKTTKLVVGYELQYSKYDSRNFGNNYGEPDTLNFHDIIKAKNNLLFGNYQIDLSEKWFLTSGISVNLNNYKINRLETHLSGDMKGLVEKRFNPQFVPRVGLAWKFHPSITAHSSLSFGFSPPTVEEIRTNEGSINTDLEPEKGINYEAGVRGYTWNGRFQFDLTLFYMMMRESIVQQQTPRGTIIFTNAGSTDQRGIELSTDIILFDDTDFLFSDIRWNNSYTYNNFVFNDYMTSSGDFSGNELTGVAPHNFLSRLSFHTKPGLYLNASFNFMDAIPLRDDNTIYSDSYQLVQFKTGFKTRILSDIEMDLYFGIDNLFDEQYSRGYDINAFGGRYYQPAPGRNWFAGIRMNYKLGI